MFGWFKKLLGGSSPPPLAETSAVVDEVPGRRGSVMEVVDRFLEANPQPTPFATHALIDAGAADLQSVQEVSQACDLIVKHGCMYPLNPTVRNEVESRELVAFLCWHRDAGIDKEDYANEHCIRLMIQRYREEKAG